MTGVRGPPELAGVRSTTTRRSSPVSSGPCTSSGTLERRANTTPRGLTRLNVDSHYARTPSVRQQEVSGSGREGLRDGRYTVPNGLEIGSPIGTTIVTKPVTVGPSSSQATVTGPPELTGPRVTVSPSSQAGLRDNRVGAGRTSLVPPGPRLTDRTRGTGGTEGPVTLCCEW